MRRSPNARSPLIVGSSARPIRAAFLVDTAVVTTGEVDQIVRYASRHWGGRLHGIFPTNRETIAAAWWESLVALDPDVVHSLVPIGDELIRRINREIAPAVLSILAEKERARRGEDRLLETGTVGGLSVNHLPRYLDHAWRASVREPTFWNIKSDSVLNADGRFALRNFGLMEGTFFTDGAFRDTRCEVLQANEQRPLEIVERASQQHGLVTPLDLAGQDAVFPVWTVRAPRSGGFQIVVGDSALDVLYAWNRGMFDHPGTGISTLWMPPSLAADPEFARVVATFIQRKYWDNNQRSGAVVSYSLSEDQLKPIAEALRTPASMFFDAFRLQPHEFPHPEFKERRRVEVRDRQLVPLTGSTALLSPPRPRFPLADKAPGQWMVDLVAEYRPELHSDYLSHRPVWRLPRRAGIAYPFFDSDHSGRVNGDEHLSVRVSRADSALEFKVPSDRDVLLQFVEKKPHNLRPWQLEANLGGRLDRMITSEEGRTLNALVELFGSLRSAGVVLGNPLLNRLIRHLAGKTSDEEEAEDAARLKKLLDASLAEGEGCDVEDLARRIAGRHPRPSRVESIRFDELEKTYYRQWWKQGSENPQERARWPDTRKFTNEQRNDVADLVERGVLLQGVRVQCPRCRHKDWLPVERLSPTVPCEGCRDKIVLDPLEPWAFRLNDMCRGAVRNTGTLATLQAAYYLEMTRGFGIGDMFLSIPSQEFYERGSTNAFAELDLLVITEGKFLAVEVKSRPVMFLPKTFKSLGKIGEELEPDELLLAAPGGSWPPEVLERISELQSRLRPFGVKVDRVPLQWM